MEYIVIEKYDRRSAGGQLLLSFKPYDDLATAPSIIKQSYAVVYRNNDKTNCDDKFALDKTDVPAWTNTCAFVKL